MIKMRDAQAFQIELRVDNETLGEIGFEQFVIFRFEAIQGECITALFNRMNYFLELGEHGLPKEGAAQIVDLPIDDVGAYFRIARLFQQMMGEQLLVKCRCYLGKKNG